MTKLRSALALTGLVLSLSTGDAQAAVITKSYVTSATFLSAPITAVTLSYTLTFDPTSRSPSGSVSNYSTSTSLAAFAAPVVTQFYSSGNAFVGRVPSGATGVSAGTDDFVASFSYDNSGNPVAGSTLVYFTTANSSDTYFSSTAETVIAPVSRVPEPATWSLMLLGFASVGSASRRARARDGKLLQVRRAT